jgi:hypothetical protein
MQARVVTLLTLDNRPEDPAAAALLAAAALDELELEPLGLLLSRPPSSPTTIQSASPSYKSYIKQVSNNRSGAACAGRLLQRQHLVHVMRTNVPRFVHVPLSCARQTSSKHRVYSSSTTSATRASVHAACQHTPFRRRRRPLPLAPAFAPAQVRSCRVSQHHMCL